MYISFKCKKCNNKFNIVDSQINDIPEVCPSCNSIISNSQYISSFFENYLVLERGLDTLDICGITSGKPDEIYSSDVNNLSEIYNHSSKEVKDLLSKILSINFLMIYHSVKDENLKKLKEYKDTLLLLWRNDMRDEDLRKILGIEKK